MIEFLNRLFGRHTSGATAKERLRLVLMSDHLSLSPEMVDAMKRDLVDVISRYVEVDRDKIDVHFEHQDKALAMLANIPITGVARNGNGTNGTNGHSTNGQAADHDDVRHPDLVASTELSAGSGPLTEAEAPAAETAECYPEPSEPLEARPSSAEVPKIQQKPKPVTAKNAARPRRKRRKQAN